MDAESKRRIRVVAAVIQHHDKYLITQRRPTAVLPLLWEFPGGRVEPDETDHQALAREVKFRLTVDLKMGGLISFVSHNYERYIVDLHLYQCSISEGKPSKANVNDFAWVGSEQFEDYWFTPADEASVAALLGLGENGAPDD